MQTPYESLRMSKKVEKSFSIKVKRSIKLGFEIRITYMAINASEKIIKLVVFDPRLEGKFHLVRHIIILITTGIEFREAVYNYVLKY